MPSVLILQDNYLAGEPTRNLGRGPFAHAIRSSLQSHSNLISSNLQQVNTSLADHHDLLASTVAFPSMQFPGRYQSDVIQMLLRTKMEPDVEEWLEQGQSLGKDMSSTSQMLRDQDRQELWQWAPGAANAEARRQKWGADYTLAEVQNGIVNVVTGLRRELAEPPPDDDMDEDEDDFGEDDNDEEEDTSMKVDSKPGAAGSSLSTTATLESTGPEMPMESVHRFMTTGKAG